MALASEADETLRSIIDAIPGHVFILDRVGSTVIYAHMQAVSMVNDHFIDCFRYRDVRRLGVSALT